MDLLCTARTGASFVALATGVLLSVSCDRDQAQAEWLQGELDRIGLSQQVELQRFRLEQRPAGNFGEFLGLADLVQVNASKLESLRLQLRALDADVASLESKWADSQKARIRDQRQRVIGKVFNTFQPASGRKFLNVSVTAIDDAGVTIRHADGSARLRFADLDAGQQAFFGLEADLALVAEEKESIASIAYERWVDGQMEVIRIRKREDEQVARHDQLAAERMATERMAAQLVVRYITSALGSPLARDATPVGRGFRDYVGCYPRYRYRHRANYSSYRYVYYRGTPCRNIGREKTDAYQFARAFHKR